MKIITRSKFIHVKLEEFLNSSSKHSLYINLFSKEIQKITRNYDNLEVTKLSDSVLNSSDNRYPCKITKK